MITPRIERAIIKGLGKVKIFNLAFSSVGKIVVPPNKFIIITDVKINPFSAIASIAAAQTAAANNLSATTAVKLVSQNEEPRVFIVRNNYSLLFDGSGNPYIQNSEPVHFDTYLTYNQTLFISCNIIPGINELSTTDYAPLNNSQIPPPPVSYGNTIPTLRSLLDGLNSNLYVPTSGEEAQASGAEMTNQPEGRTDANTKIPDPSALQNNNTPLVFVQYVIMNQNITSLLT